MGVKNTKRKTILCFELDVVTCEDWMLAVRPEGSSTVLVMSPYFIKKIYNYAIGHKILEGKIVK